MADHFLQRGVVVAHAIGADERGGEVDADHAAALADRRELLVGQIARMRADHMRVRMGCDQRSVGESRHVPETLFVQVRQVEHDPEAVAGLHQLDTPLGEAGAGIGRGRIAERHAVAEDVGAAPDRPMERRPLS